MRVAMGGDWWYGVLDVGLLGGDGLLLACNGVEVAVSGH